MPECILGIQKGGAEPRISQMRMVHAAGAPCAIAAVIVGIGSLGHARPQANSQNPLPEQMRPVVFEVASMKLAAPSDRRGSIRGGPGTNDPGLFICTNMPLRSVLLKAWALPLYQLSGPSSIETEKYDITAKVPPGATKEDLNLMIQSLLAERLGLVVHHETKELPIYEMWVAKGGLKMKEAGPLPKSRSHPSRTGATGMAIRNSHGAVVKGRR